MEEVTHRCSWGRRQVITGAGNLTGYSEQRKKNKGYQNKTGSIKEIMIKMETKLNPHKGCGKINSNVKRLCTDNK